MSNKIEITDRTAYFICLLEKSPYLITADKDRANLSENGEWYFGREIRETLIPVMQVIASIDEVKTGADRYRKEHCEEMSGGTVLIELSEPERRNLFDLIGQVSEVDMHEDHILKLMKTRAVI